MNLPQTITDRIVWAIVSPLLLIFLALFLMMTFFWAPQDFPMRMLKYVAEDVLVLFASTFALIFMWCLFTPKWIDNLLTRRTPRLIACSVVVVVGLVVILLVSEGTRAF